MKIIVLAKQVPEIEKVKFDLEKGRLDRTSAEAVINPFDLNALETAVQLKEKVGGTVIALSMGPDQAETALRDTIARGADEAILLTDQRFVGSDTLATSYTLASAIKKLGSFDLVVCGEKTVDGDTAQVGPEVAEFLNIPHVAFVEEIVDTEDQKIVIKSRMDKYHNLVELKLPGLITVTKDINNPRLPTFRDKMKSRRATLEKWNAEKIAKSEEMDNFGFNGSPTWVVKVYAPPSGRRKGQLVKEAPEKAAERIAQILRNAKVTK